MLALLPPDYNNISTPCKMPPICKLKSNLTWHYASTFTFFSIPCTVADSASLKGLGYGDGLPPRIVSQQHPSSKPTPLSDHSFSPILSSRVDVTAIQNLDDNKDCRIFWVWCLKLPFLPADITRLQLHLFFMITWLLTMYDEIEFYW